MQINVDIFVQHCVLSINSEKVTLPRCRLLVGFLFVLKLMTESYLKVFECVYLPGCTIYTSIQDTVYFTLPYIF